MKVLWLGFFLDHGLERKSLRPEMHLTKETTKLERQDFQATMENLETRSRGRSIYALSTLPLTTNPLICSRYRGNAL